ncbi:MAG: exodeoxyribonuclease I [Proteobacteria bacterium]|nr:exodeoxyribonuclease I [Pseudomonadota bacterium]
METFYWYDLETFGKDPKRSRIAQFAGLRTDEDLNPLGEPLVLYCQPADDLLPSPEATLVTGITPQHALREGLREADFMRQVLDELALPHTCTTGYNSLRFDDEFIRYGAWRNFHDPYSHTWRNGNSRWDLLDVMRLAHALRPDGIVWPQRAAPERADAAGAGSAVTTEESATSFKLTDLTAANDIGHESAHDALSDVRALVEVARLLKRAQPRLFDYALKLRDKRYAGDLLDVASMQPVLHISGKYPATRHNAALVAPICRHPSIETRVIVLDLDTDPQALLDLDPADIADRLYTPARDLPEGETRIALKEIHLNRCPMLVELKSLRAVDYERLRIDPDLAQRRAQKLRDTPGLATKVRAVYAQARGPRADDDVDTALYAGFVPESDQRLFPQIRAAAPESLPAFAARLRDARLPELLLRYQARNWPESLDAQQRQRWDDQRRQRLEHDAGLSEFSFDTHADRVAALRAIHAEDGRVQVLLDALDDWRAGIQRSLS